MYIICFLLHVCVCASIHMFCTYDLDVRAGSDARGNIGGDTLPLPVVLLSEWLEL